MKSEAKLMLSLAAGAALVLACTPQSDGVSRPASSASVLAQKHSAMPSSATSAGSPDTESRDTSESPTTAESPTTEQSPTSAESAESSAASAPQLPVQRPAATTPQPPAASSQKPAGPATATFVANASGLITFYAAADNDPAGSRDISHPMMHQEAGGTGTFADPLTFAVADGQFAPGTKIYVPEVKRYFILEDNCATCSGSHIDLWAGPATDSGVIACEDSLTRDGSGPYEVNPPAGLPVDAGDLYQNGSCYHPA